MSIETDIFELTSLLHQEGDKKLVLEARKIALKILRGAVLLTPVDSGIMRNSWIISRNKLRPQEGNILKGGNSSRSRSQNKRARNPIPRAQAELKRVIATDRSIYVQNRVNYAALVLARKPKILSNPIRQALKK